MFMSKKDFLQLIALVVLVGGAFIYVFIPWLWQLLKPFIHQITA